jgi:hypothetical protein
MITLKDFMEVCDYKITEGSAYCWQCFGPDAYRLDSWNQEQDGHTVSIVFDTRTQVVYEVTAYDYRRNHAYRLINPEFKSAHDNEATERDIDINQAWDDVNYIDLDVVDDFIQKALAIVNEEDYDTRVQVPVDFTDEELLQYMKLAHERDMTFNELVEEALRAAIDDFKMRDEYDFFDAERGPVEQTVKKLKKKKKDKK